MNWGVWVTQEYYLKSTHKFVGPYGFMVEWLPTYRGKWAIWEKELSWAGATILFARQRGWGVDKMLTSNVLGEVFCADV